MDIDSDQASAGARALARALCTVISVVSENLAQESRSVFHDFASFMRLAIADAAEQVGDSAHNAAEALRDVDNDVQEGKRNEIGIKREADSSPEDANARAKFEKAMDSTKEAGSKVIGAGQAVAAAGEDLANRTTNRLQDAFYKVCCTTIHVHPSSRTSRIIAHILSRVDMRPSSERRRVSQLHHDHLQHGREVDSSFSRCC